MFAGFERSDNNVDTIRFWEVL